MTEHTDIDELLNSFVDGELTPRQHVEVQRLIAHDPEIARRLNELRKCKMLVSTLPHAKAPADTLEEIKTSLERKALLGHQTVESSRRAGARDLFIRKVLTAAAMIGLVSTLAIVIYTIVGLARQEQKPLPAKDKTDLKTPAVATEPPSKTLSPPLDTVVSIEPEYLQRTLYARLRLETKGLTAVNSFLNKIIKSNNLHDCTISDSPDKTPIYVLECTRHDINTLLAEMNSIWGELDSASLSVETEKLGEQIEIGQVTCGQISQIINQNSPQESIKLAGDFAVFNSIAQLTPGQNTITALQNQYPSPFNIPKPVLTSNDKQTTPPVTQKQGDCIHLTITLAASQYQ